MSRGTAGCPGVPAGRSRVTTRRDTVTNAKGTFEISSMGEDTLRELDGGAKLSHANGTQRFSGDIEGDGSVEWLMCYLAGGGASYVGLQRIEGSLAGRKGSFVIEAAGRFDGAASSGSWTVVEGSGAGEL